MKDKCNLKFEFKELLYKIFNQLEYAINKKLKINRCKMLIYILQKMIEDSMNKEETQNLFV